MTAAGAVADLFPATRAGRRARAATRWTVAAVTLVAAFAAFGILTETLAPGPSGPVSSSYTTAPQGLAAWAELLSQAGHPVSQLRTPLAQAQLNPGTTVVVLDADALLAADQRRLDEFLSAGGRLVIGGSSPARTLPASVGMPAWTDSAPTTAHAVADLPVTAGARLVQSSGSGAWTTTGGATPALESTPNRILLLSRAVGPGTAELLADSSPVQNALLDSADNAQLALDLAGSAGRPVVFVESVHGYGPARGLAAIPTRGWLVFAGLALAGLAWVLSRGRRLGPAEASERALPPPRKAYVDAISRLLGRTRATAPTIALLRADARRQVARRARLRGDATAAELRAAMDHLGLPPAEIGAVLGERRAGPPPNSHQELLTLGAALARLRRSA